MASDSSVAGYLPFTTDNGLYDDALEDFYHDVLVGLTGLPNNLVRPKFIQEPSQQPGFEVNWMTFSLLQTSADSQHYEGHAPDDEGTTTIERDRIITARHTFYGPNMTQYAERLRTMLSLSQNRDQLIGAGFGWISTGDLIPLPALIKERWVHKCEILVRYRFRAATLFRVLNLLSAQATINTDEPPRSVSIEVNP